MGVRSLRRWAWIHKWTSLICTVFLLLICVTGLPLLFREEIEGWLEPHAYEQLPDEAPQADLDKMAADARALYPGQVIASIYRDDDEPQTYVWMAPSWRDYNTGAKTSHFIRFDSRTGKLLEQSKPESEQAQSFTGIMLNLHKDLFAGLTGEMFMAVMALLFLVATASGAVLYSPFARKLAFGTVRADRSTRIRWLDLHNLLGVATLAWVLVVGATGLMNEMSTPLFGLWQRTDVRKMLAEMGSTPDAMPAEQAMSSVQGAWNTATAAAPSMRGTSVVFPGSKFGTPTHYLVWTKGNSPLTARLFTPILVDARSGALSALVKMPWYLRALELSRPLHFGDYGGMPLKILWGLLDLVTIAVLGSGLYLWLSRRRTSMEQKLDELLGAEMGSAAE